MSDSTTDVALGGIGSLQQPRNLGVETHHENSEIQPDLAHSGDVLADRERRFQRYLEHIGVSSRLVPLRYTGFHSEDDYMEQRVFELVEPQPQNSTVTIDDSVRSSYDRYDVHRPQKIKEIIQNEDGTTYPGMKYDDCLEVTVLDELRVEELNSVYKNNLCECFDNFLVIGHDSSILILEDEIKLKEFDTRPVFTTRAHSDAATWPYFPHQINQVKVCQLRGKRVLICCVDDGRVVVYDLSEVREDKDLPVMLEITMTSSVWGIDVKEDYIAVSDNSQVVTLFYVGGGKIEHGETVEMYDNVPDVKILSVTETRIHVVCTSISGLFSWVWFDHHTRSASSDLTFTHNINYALIRETEKHHMSSEVANEANLGDHGWTVNAVESKFFLEVTHPSYLGGYETIDPQEILQRSRILGLMKNHLMSSDLGGAARLETIHLKTTFDHSEHTSTVLGGLTDQMRHIERSFLGHLKESSRAIQTHPEFEVRFFVVTTPSNVALYRGHHLICNAVTGDLFDFELPEASESLNRISIAKVIPEISTAVVVSQAGFFTVFRLVKHRGLHSLREEFVWPRSRTSAEMQNHSAMCSLGLGVRQIDPVTFWLYLPRGDGRVFKFELKENVQSSLEMALL